jgi:hypothetical protein
MLVGISGQASAGKDTSADILSSKMSFAKLSFADPLKRIVKEIYDFSYDQLWGPSANRNAPDFRYLREEHLRHDWQEEGSGWRCARCGLPGDKGGPTCKLYLTPR